MSWKKLKKQYYIIVEKIKKKKNLFTDWLNFQTLTLQISKNPPQAIFEIQNSLEIIEKIKPKSKIRFFYHECGGGLKVIYFAAIGYKNVYGVNVNFDVFLINKILKTKFKVSEIRFLKTEGKNVPFKKNFFDFIISARVLEHLTDEEAFLCYSEEGRVLKENGFAYHEVPHKYISYESYYRLWFIRFFPYFCKPFLYGLFLSIQKKKNLFSIDSFNADYFSKNFLILRSPHFHKKILIKNIESFIDLNYNRLFREEDISSYDNDSPIILRKFIQKLFIIPLLGKFLALICKNFFIPQTLSKKVKNNL